MSYKDLEIWKLSRELVIDIHASTLKLPSFEQNEIGRQIRKSIKSVKSNIVEGYGRRQYKPDFIRFLVTASASNLETIDHWETLFETNSLSDVEEFKRILCKLGLLGRKIYGFINAVKRSHSTDVNNPARNK